MNERIKELSEQSNINFGRMAILGGDPKGMARFVSYSEFEKFAELLVLETLRVIGATGSQHQTALIYFKEQPTKADSMKYTAFSRAIEAKGEQQ